MIWLRHTARWLGTQLLRIAAEPTAAASSDDQSHAQGSSAASAMNIYIISGNAGPLRQGEILSDVIQRRRSFQSLTLAGAQIEEIRHPYCVIATQDCDLEQDHAARNGDVTAPDKMIPNVLLLQAVTVAELIAGLPKGRDILKRVIGNRDDRYQLFEPVVAANDALGQGLPALGVDFKRYFTVPMDELYLQLGSDARRRTQLNSNYLEHFNQRFSGYLSRVALLREHRIEQ